MSQPGSGNPKFLATGLITTDLHIAAKLNIIISKSITSMTFAMSYAQRSEVNERYSYRRKLN